MNLTLSEITKTGFFRIAAQFNVCGLIGLYFNTKNRQPKVPVCLPHLITLLVNVSIGTNSVDPDQTAPAEAVWSGSTRLSKRLLKLLRR